MQILRTAVDHVREVTAALLAAVDSVVLLHEDQFLCVALELCIFQSACERVAVLLRQVVHVRSGLSLGRHRAVQTRSAEEVEIRAHELLADLVAGVAWSIATVVSSPTPQPCAFNCSAIVTSVSPSALRPSVPLFVFTPVASAVPAAEESVIPLETL